MGGEEFFDEFGAGSAVAEEVLLSDADFQRLRDLFLDKSLGLEELHAAYKRALEEILESQGRSIEWAQEHHGTYPFVAAYASTAELEAVRAEAAAAHAEAARMTAKEEWTPPPPDAEPETAQDYE